jgi:ferredoxin
MQIRVNRDLCTGAGFCERCLSRLFIYPTVVKPGCLEIVDDKRSDIRIELRAGASGIRFTLNDKHKAILAGESYAGFSDLASADGEVHDSL